MSSLSIVTPSYWRDFESCRLLCDSIDTYATGYSRHYILVLPEDRAKFSVLAGPKRDIVDVSRLIPFRLFDLPIAWKARRYVWAPGLTAPIYGWHTQQLFKIAMTLTQPEERALHIDSDIWFCRPADLSVMARANATPLRQQVGAIGDSLPRHIEWWRNAHLLLGFGEAPIPGDDYIGGMITWERASVAAMVARIETVTGRPWAQAIARTRDFSEYLLYGLIVARTPELLERHKLVTESPCHVYWEGPALNETTFAAFTRDLRPDQSTICIQSSTETPIELSRGFILGNREMAA